MMPVYTTNEVIGSGRNALTKNFVNPAGMIAWSLQLFVLTTPGAPISGIVIAICLVYHFPDRPWLAIFAPIYLLPLVFLAFILMFVSLFTDLATGWVFKRMFGTPEPKKLLHRIGHFALSIPICALVSLVFGMSGESVCSGAVRYCE